MKQSMATAHSPGYQHSDRKISPQALEEIRRYEAIHELQNKLLFQLELAKHFLLGRPVIRDIRFNMRAIEETMDAIEALENGAPLT